MSGCRKSISVRSSSSPCFYRLVLTGVHKVDFSQAAASSPVPGELLGSCLWLTTAMLPAWSTLLARHDECTGRLPLPRCSSSTFVGPPWHRGVSKRPKSTPDSSYPRKRRSRSFSRSLLATEREGGIRVCDFLSAPLRNHRVTVGMPRSVVPDARGNRGSELHHAVKERAASDSTSIRPACMMHPKHSHKSAVASSLRVPVSGKLCLFGLIPLGAATNVAFGAAWRSSALRSSGRRPDTDVEIV